MTGENGTHNAVESLARAAQCLHEAQVLLRDGSHYGAVSRAYYAVFHGARALLFAAGLEARSHRGVINLVGAHYVRSGRLPPEMGRLLSRMQRDREDADYEGGMVFTADQSSEAVDNASRFLEEVHRVLASPTGA